MATILRISNYQTETKLKIKSKALALFFSLLFILFGLFSARAQFNFSDQASNYGGTWPNGSNFGTGYNAWAITTGGSNAGTFIGNPSSNGMGTAGIGTTAHGLFGHTGQFVNAVRFFGAGGTNVPMQIGDVFSFHWAMNWDCGSSGSKGFDLREGTTTIFNVNNTNSATITTTNGNANTVYGTDAMLVTLTRISWTQYTFSMTSRSGGATFNTTINSTANINNINIYCGAQQDNNGNRNIYFNNFNFTKAAPYETNFNVTEPRILSGSNNLTKTGAGNLTLTGVNTFTGNVIVNANMVIITNDNQLGAAPGAATANKIQLGAGTLGVNASITINANRGITLNNAASTIDVFGTNTATYNGIIAGTGGLTKAGPGTLILGGANTYTGTTTVSTGILRISNINALGTTAGGTTVASGAALELNAGADYPAEPLTLNGTGISNGGALRKIDTGDRNYLGNITLGSDARINVTGGGLVHRDANLNLAGNTLYLGGNQNFVMGVNIDVQNASKTTGDGAIFKDGTGWLEIRPQLSMTGNIILQEGIIRHIVNTAYPTSGLLIIRAGTQYRSNDGTARTVQKPIRVEGNFEMGHSGGGAITFEGAVDLNAGTRTITMANNNTISGAISNGSLTKAGAGSLTLSGSNTYAGNTNINAGNLTAASAGAFGGGTDVFIANGATLTVSASTSAASVREAGTSNSGTVILNTGTILTINGANKGSFFQNSISGAGGLTMAGSGTTNMNLFGTQSYSGATTVSGGQLTSPVAMATSSLTVSGGVFSAGGANILGNTIPVTVNGGTYQLGGTQTIGSLAGTGGTVSLSASTLTTGNDNTNTTYSGVISGTGGLTKIGTGTFTLDGSAKTYTGATTVNNGTLTVGATNVINAASNLVLTNGTFNLPAGTDLTLNSANMTGGEITHAGNNSFTLNNSSSFTGGTVTFSSTGSIITNGTTTLGNVTFNSTSASATTHSTILLGGDVLVNNNTTANFTNTGGGSGVRFNLGDAIRTINIGSNAILNIDWRINSTTPSSGGIIKTGSGRLTLTHESTVYTGPTTVTDGELRLNPVSTTATWTSPVTLNGGTLATTGIAANTTITNATAGVTLNLNANSTINLDNVNHSLIFANSSAVTWNGSDLTIFGWTGTAGFSGTNGKIFFGNNSSGLNASQLAKITFDGFASSAVLLNSGELVPSNSSLYFRTVSSGDWATPAIWEAADNLSFTGAFSPSYAPNNSNCLLIQIRNGHTVTISGNTVADDLVIDAGGVLTHTSGTLTINNGPAATDFLINGTFNANAPLTINSGAGVTNNNLWQTSTTSLTSAGSSITQAGTAVYNHAANGGTIPISTWNAGALLRITGITNSSTIGGMGQTFHHVEYNCPSQTSTSVQLQGEINGINGNFTMVSTGGTGREFRFFTNSTNTNSSLTVQGNFIMTGGIVAVTNSSSSGSANPTLNINGNLSISGSAIFDLTGSSAFTAAGTTVNLSGDLIISGTASIIRTQTTPSTFRFNRVSGNQTFTAHANAINLNQIVWQVGNGSTQPVVNLASNFAMNTASGITVQAGARLNCGTHIVTGNTFTMNSGAALGIGSPQGIVTAPTASGNIQTTTRNYHLSNGLYYYMGSVDQVTGNALPNTMSNQVNTLGIETTGGARVTQNTADFVTVANTLQLSSGIYILNSNDLRLLQAATVSGTPSASAMVVTIGTSRYAGRFMKLFSNPSFTGSFTFPLGDITGTVEYSPVTLNLSYTGASAPNYYALKCLNTKQPLDPSLTNFLNRHWQGSAHTNWYGASGTATMTFAYLPADVVGTASLLKHNRFGWSGVYAGQWFEDAASSSAANTITSATLSLEDIRDVDHVGRLFQPLYFQSNVAIGAWELPGSWLVSPDPTFVAPPGVVPSIFPIAGNSEGIRILNGHNIVYNSTISAPLSIDQTTINNGGTLTMNTNTVMVVNDGLGVDFQVNGNLVLQGGVTMAGISPTYSSTSNLVYNSGTNNVNIEWTGNAATPGLGVPNNVIINGGTVNMPNTARGLAGNFTFNAGSFVLNTALGADLSVAGNWTRNNSGATFTPNNRAVFFNGAGTQIVSTTGGGTESFPFLFITKPTGTWQINNSPATNVTVTGNSGNIFSINSSSGIDLNGRTLDFTGTGGNINANGGIVSINSAAGGFFSISGGTKTITSSSGGTFNFGSNTSVLLNNGLDFGLGLSTLMGTLSINSGGFVNINSPVYGTGSTLVYNTGGAYGVGSEWTSTTSGPATSGRPHHVTAQTSTVNMPGASRALAGNLTINSTVNLNTTSGSDLFIGSNLINNGTLNTNNRQISFSGSSGVQNISGTAATTIDFLEVNNPDGLELLRNITVDDRVLFTNGRLLLNNFNLTHNRIFNPAFQGVNASRYVVTNGTGRLVQQVSTSNVDYPIGPNASSYNPMLINQQATAEQIGIRAVLAPPFSHTLVDPNQMVNVEYNINESVNGANNIFTQFNWNGTNEASGFVRNSGVFHGHWNGTEWVVRPSSATTGTNPYQSNSTVNFTGILGSGGVNFAVGNINAFFSCILTQVAGNWENPSTWVLGVVPPTDASVCIAHPISINGVDADISNVTINSGGGLTIQPGRTLRILNNGAIINNSGTVADLGNGNLRFNGVGSTSGPNGFVLNNVEIFGNTSLNTSTTINGNLTINNSSFIIVGNPIYGPTGSLIYNTTGTYFVSNEWTGNSLTPGSGIPFNVTIQNGTILNMPAANRGLAGNINITNGGLNLNPTSGDLFVGGNWTRNSSSTTFTANNRAVFFNGAGNQVVTIDGGGTESFPFLFLTKPSGIWQINNSPATNVSVTGNSGTIFSITSTSSIDLNGRTLAFTGTGGNINANGGLVTINSAAGGFFTLSGGAKTITSTGGGAFNFGSNTVVLLGSGLNFGAGLSTINGILRIILGGSVIGNAPFYGSNSTLHYFSGTTYNRGIEWSATSGAGYPANVLISRNGTNTPLNLFGTGSALRQISGNLTIENGGSLDMGSMSDPLVVLGNLVIGEASNPNGSFLSLGLNPNGDLRIGGNLFQNTGATFIQNSRQVEMIGSAPQSITGVSSFNFLKIENSGSTVSIQNNVNIVNRLWLATGTLNLNGFAINLTNGSQIRRSASTATMNNVPSITLGQSYDVRYDASMSTGNEYLVGATQVRDVEINNATLTLSGNRTFNRDLILNTSNLDLNGFTMVARGRATAPAFSGSITVTGGGTRNVTGPTGSRFDITGLGANFPLDYTKTVSTFGGTLLSFGSNVTVRIGDGSVDFGAGSPTTVNGVLQVLLGGSVGQILNPCFYGVNSVLRFANTVDYIVVPADKTWAAGSISSGLPGIPFNVEVLDLGTDLTLPDTRALRGNLTINNGTFTLTPAYTGTFNLGGNWTRTGASSAFVHNNKKVVFDGLVAGSQFITVGSGVSAETFYDLEIAPASGIITFGANTNVNVLNNLNFVSSKLDLASSTNTLRIGTASANGTITGINSSRYIISNGGKLRLSTNSNGIYLFPFGDASEYTPYELNLVTGATSGSYVDGTVFVGAHPNFAILPLSYINRYWRIEPTGLVSPSYNAKYYYAPGDVFGAGVIKAVKYSYTNPTPGWLEGPPNSGGGPANGVEGTFTNHDTGIREFTWDGLQTFSDFTGAGDGSPLPVTLVSLNAQPINGNEVLVTWATASEINNHYFTVYRSKDAVNYQEIGTVNGAGNSNITLNYQLIDKQPFSGINYYKLRQTDFNGDFEEFGPVAVMMGSSIGTTAMLFPNPANEMVTVSLNSKAADNGVIQIFNVAGALIWQQQIQTNDGANLLKLDISDLAAGNYMVSIRLNGSFINTLPLIINR